MLLVAAVAGIGQQVRLGDGARHQYYDLPMIVVGKAQGQIMQGRFLTCSAPQPDFAGIGQLRSGLATLVLRCTGRFRFFLNLKSRGHF